MGLQKYFSKFLLRPKHKPLSDKEQSLANAVKKLTGFSPLNLHLYQEAFSLKTTSNRNGKNYERLEFLGDAVLGSIISCFLFSTYTHCNEGFLTQMKAKIVNRKSLNKIGEELRLTTLIQNGGTTIFGENICGNLLEALIGAIYLDMGFEVCRDVVLQRFFPPSEITKLENMVMSYKGLLLEWSQKKKCVLKYETSEEHLPDKTLVFRSVVYLGQQKVANAAESSKKKAEEKAAQRAFYILNKKENILEKSKTVS